MCIKYFKIKVYLAESTQILSGQLFGPYIKTKIVRFKISFLYAACHFMWKVISCLLLSKIRKIILFLEREDVSVYATELVCPVLASARTGQKNS